ncbi:MAG: amidase, partial [Hyphomicrobiaceae bacterium]
RAAADAASVRYQRNRPLGPHDGVPITVKDNIHVKGLRSTWGSMLFADYVPGEDELPVARLREAGAVVLGKTNCPEFTLQGYTDNPLFGVTRNPFDLSLTPGGSSGGAVAAVAAGIAPIAIATDGGGSIRRPCAYTGLVGLKPSRGRVPRSNGFPSVLLDFETIGPIARTPADVALVMDAIASSDIRDPASIDLEGDPFVIGDVGTCRMLYVPRFGRAPVDLQIAETVDQAVKRLQGMGHRVDIAEVPFDIAALDVAWPVISQTGLAWFAATKCAFDDRVSAPLRAMKDGGAGYSAVDYFDALMKVRELKQQLFEVFSRYDVILTPTTAALPWPATEIFPEVIAGQKVGGRGHAVFTAFVNLSGCGGINVPCGMSSEGIPIGLQFVAAPKHDGLLVSLALQCQAAQLWTPVRPDRLLA